MQRLQDEEERNDDEDEREDLAHQDPAHRGLSQDRRVAREPVRRGQRDEHGEDRVAE